MILVFPFRRRRHGQYTDGVNGNQDRFGQQPVGLVPIHESRAYTSIKWQGSLVQGRFPPESEQPMILVQLGSSPNWQPTTSRAGQFPARIGTTHDSGPPVACCPRRRRVVVGSQRNKIENHFSGFLLATNRNNPRFWCRPIPRPNRNRPRFPGRSIPRPNRNRPRFPGRSTPRPNRNSPRLLPAGSLLSKAKAGSRGITKKQYQENHFKWFLASTRSSVVEL